MEQRTNGGFAAVTPQISFIECCERYPEKKPVIHQKDNDGSDFLTGKELQDKIRTLGNALQQELEPQEKAVLLFPQGLEYIYSLIACWYANVIAVPAPVAEPSLRSQDMEKISLIFKESGAACIITDTCFKEFLKTEQAFSSANILDIRQLLHNGSDSGLTRRPYIPEDIALLLYTSGSTSQPKGIAISHSSLMFRTITAAAQWEIGQESCIVSWMPQFHSFGLLINILTPLLKGASSILLNPDSFLKKPEEWFKTIAQYRATHTAAPNFAFDYCCSFIDIPSVKDFSLQTLKAVICGGEPVRKETCEDFITKFRSLGIGENVFCPHYGLSEMVVTTKKPGQPLRFLNLDIPSLEKRKIKCTKRKNKSKFVTSCGEIPENMEISIVHPETCKPCLPDEIGEIWVKSPSVEVGYLKRKGEVESAFSGMIDGTEEKGFLRTGDLGFVADKHLYIVGREKDVIIIHGKNHHPVDIEWTISKSVPEINLPVAVFSCEIDAQEKVIAVQEIEALPDEAAYEKMAREMLGAVSETHGIEIYDINLVEKGGIPRTGSGKIQRKACRSAYMNNELPVIFQYRNGTSRQKDAHEKISAVENCDIAEILKKDVFLPILRTSLPKIEAASAFSELGLDSIKYVQISKKIQDIFKIQFTPSLLFKYRSLETLAGYLSTRLAEPQPQSAGRYGARGEVPENPCKAESREIAVIGMSCHFPGGAADVDSFWDNLVQQKDCITPISKSRPQIIADYQSYYGSLEDSFPQWSGFIEDVDRFDAPFFGISPLEAESMDPQQRKLMELTWSVIENSGYNPYDFAGKDIGLFMGVHSNDYAELVSQCPSLLDTYGAFLDSGLHMSLITHRVSRWFDFHGPSEMINTACSSSLVAIHHAVESICRGESSLAIAGGVNLILAPRTYRASHKAGMLSKDGHCKTFDEKADGFVRAEGFGAVLLKPYSQAVEDGDTIYGIVKVAAINHDGKSNSLRAPNLNAQKQLIKSAYQQSGLPIETVSYIETHGTGTSLGDPIEFQALQEAFQEVNPDIANASCGLGAVKTNIGHCESAAGIAGVIKVLLSMKHRTLPGILHFKKLNPYIPLQNSPFYIVERNKKWERAKDAEGREIPLRAGVSSFGFGGANAHVILEEHIPLDIKQEVTVRTNKDNICIVPISAKNKECLQAYAKRLSSFLKKTLEAGANPDADLTPVDLTGIAYTLQTGRAAMEERAVFLVKEIAGLIQKLDDFGQGEENIKECWYGRIRQKKDSTTLPESGESFHELIHQYITEGKLDKIAQHWVQGGRIDWNLLYGQVRLRRLNLPTYAFSRIRYWLPDTGNHGSQEITGEQTKGLETHPVGEGFADEGGSKARKPCFVQKQWEPGLTGPERKSDRTVAILTTQETRELADQLANYFTGSKILDIHGLESQFQRAEYAWEDFDGCVDLAGCGKIKNQSMSWIRWLQQLIELGRREGLMMLCVTRGLESYQNTDVNLSGATHAGLYRMLQSEYGHIRSRHMDVELSLGDIELAQQIASEFFTDSEDTEVCYRNGKRYRSCLGERCVDTCNSQRTVFPEDHVLWITGGTRGLGYLCAQHFVKHYGVKRLVLTGREVLPSREQWDAYENQNSSTAQKIRAIRALEAEGIQVQVLSLALTDENTVMQSLQEIKGILGPVGGVIHCAGFSDSENPAFIRKSQAGIRQVLDPKVAGLDVLYHNFRNEPLRFFVLFSSVSSVIPSLSAGYSDYAMANAYMDYFAEAETHHCPIYSIQWPCWKETGMGEVKSKVYERTGLLSLTDEEGLTLLDHILSRRMGPVVLPAVVNPSLWKPGQLMQRAIQGSVFKSEPLPEANQVHVSVAPADLNDAAQAWLVALFSKELRIDPSTVEVDKPFQDYGVDSILLAQLTRSIKLFIKEEVDPSTLLEYSNIKFLTEWLARTYTSSLSKALGTSDAKADGIPAQAPPVPLSAEHLQKQTMMQEGQRAAIHHKETNWPDIAVIGFSCRFPGAQNPEEYWQLLSQGRSAIGPIPEERWGYPSRFYAALLDNITHFDPKFFLIPEEDARVMDPQAFVLLEESLKLWYHAGYTHQEIKGKPVGVYIGARSQHQPGEYVLRGARNPVVAAGQNYLASNISQFFDLRGPSIVLDTACSSALVAMNMAIQSLKSGEIESALVGAVSLLSSDGNHRMFEQRGILNPEPAFHVFDQRAHGVILGEGAGMVLLKALDRALEDGDRIYAVIKGFAMNNDGRTAGPATPNLQAQKEVLQTAVARSGKKEEEISYIETNGSGTEVTDLLELKAIQSVYRPNGRVPLGLGSIKPNIGHPLCAEGMASFIKVVLMLNHRRFVPFLSGVQPMTHYNMESSPFYFCRELTEWTDPRPVAAINCFADGGTNAHVILEAWDNPASHPVNRHPLTVQALNRHNIYSAGGTDMPLLKSRSNKDLPKKSNWWAQSAIVNK